MYSSLDQVKAAFPPVLTAIGVGSFDVASSNVESYYIYTADGLIDAFLSRRYTTPITPHQPILTRISCDLVIYDMFRDRNLKVPDFMQDRWDGAMSILKDLRDGKMELPGATLVDTGDNFAYSNNLGYHPTFSPVLDELDQRVDRDLVLNEQNDRIDDCDVE